MLSVTEILVFVLFAGFMLAWTAIGVERMVAAVARGHRRGSDRFGGMARRLAASLADALLQRTMTRDRPLVAVVHAGVFYGFVFYLLVNVVDAAVGLLPAAWTAWVHAPWMGPYRFVAEVATVSVLLAVAAFVVRRFVLRDPALSPGDDLRGSPADAGVPRDSAIVAGFIAFHVGSRFVAEVGMIASDGHVDRWQPLASAVAAGIGFAPSRDLLWHLGWWGALGSIVAFLPYLLRSKHLHLFVAPVNLAAWRAGPDGRRASSGLLEPLDLEDETAEVFGAARLEDLHVAQILDAYACIQCHRCTDACPAHATGKRLSPSALEIGKRYELTSVAGVLAAGDASPRPLLAFALDEEQIWACTTCGACIDACPVGNEPMLDIVDMRRERVLMEGSFPSELQGAFRGMERNGNPWGMHADGRMEWAEGLEVPTVEDRPDFEVLFWVGCAGSFDPGAQRTTRAMTRILDHAGVRYAVLGKGERCTGDPARRAGNEYLSYQLATENVETLNAVMAGDLLDPSAHKRIVTTCPHCYHALLHEYPALGGTYDVVHHTEILDELVAEGRLPPLDLGRGTTYHDPCYLGRHGGRFDEPRRVLTSGGDSLTEMPRSRSKSFCCGAGGAQFWKEESPGTERMAEARLREARDTGAEVVAVACPFCASMLGSAAGRPDDDAAENLEIVDVAVLYDTSLERIRRILA